MKTDIVIDISPPITYLARFWFLSYGSNLLSANQITVFFKMQYFKKKVKDEVYFWHAHNYSSFLQVDNIILGVHSQVCPKYLK